MFRDTKISMAFKLLRVFRKNTQGFTYKTAARFLCGILTKSEMEYFLRRADIREEIDLSLGRDKRLSFKRVADKIGCSEGLVRRVWKAMCEEYPKNTSVPTNFCVGIPKQQRAREVVESILSNAGFYIDESAGVIVDISQQIEPIKCRIERGSIMPRHLRRRNLHLAFLGNDKIKEAEAAARQSKELDPVNLDIVEEFAVNAFRMCMALPKAKEAEAKAQDWSWFNDKIIATSYPATLKEELAKRGVVARKIMYLDGGVEGACEDFAADAIMDIVQTGRSLAVRNLVVFDTPLYPGNVSLIRQQGQHPIEPHSIMMQFVQRLRNTHFHAKAA